MLESVRCRSATLRRRINNSSWLQVSPKESSRADLRRVIRLLIADFGWLLTRGYGLRNAEPPLITVSPLMSNS